MSHEVGEAVVKEILHVSERPWSAYTEADYTIEQWHAACLIHLHDGPPTSKSQCKLPVKTPNGALSRNGVHAAAAALAGARSPLKAPPEQKAKAAAALRRYYSQLGESPPDSLKQSAMVDEFLEHFGVKGMKWGVRRKATVGPQEVFVRGSKVPGSKRLVTKGGKGHPTVETARRAREIGQIGKKSGLHALSDQQLQDYARRIQLEQNVARLQYNEKSRGGKFVDQFLGRQGSQLANAAARESGAKVGRAAVARAIKRGGKVAAVAAA